MKLDVWVKQLKEPNIVSIYERLYRTDNLEFYEKVYDNNEDFFDRLNCTKYEVAEMIYYGDWKATDNVVYFDADGSLVSSTKLSIIADLDIHRLELTRRFLEECQGDNYMNHLIENYGPVEF